MNENNSNITEELIQRGFIVDEKTKAVKGFNANEFALYIKSRMYIIYAKDCYFYLYEGGVWIYNKTANISNENETEGKGFNTQYFKSIVGEDTINAEQKNKPVFSFKPTAKIVMSMNNS